MSQTCPPWTAPTPSVSAYVETAKVAGPPRGLSAGFPIGRAAISGRGRRSRMRESTRGTPPALTAKIAALSAPDPPAQHTSRWSSAAPSASTASSSGPPGGNSAATGQPSGCQSRSARTCIVSPGSSRNDRRTCGRVPVRGSRFGTDASSSRRLLVLKNGSYGLPRKSGELGSPRSARPSASTTVIAGGPGPLL